MQHSFYIITCFNPPSLSGQVFCRDGNVHSAGSEGVSQPTSTAAAGHLVVGVPQRIWNPTSLFFLTASSIGFPLLSSRPLLTQCLSYCHTVLFLLLLCYCDSCVTTALQQYFSIFHTWTAFLELTPKNCTTFPSSFLQQSSFLAGTLKKPTVLV